MTTFEILLDTEHGLYRYSSHGRRKIRAPSDIDMDRGAALRELAQLFRGFSGDLKQVLEFWEKVQSARLYGLVKTDFDPTLPLENLRELVKVTEEVEATA